MQPLEAGVVGNIINVEDRTSQIAKDGDIRSLRQRLNRLHNLTHNQNTHNILSVLLSFGSEMYAKSAKMEVVCIISQLEL